MDKTQAHIIELAVAQLTQATRQTGRDLFAIYPPMFLATERPSTAHQWTIETVDGDGNVYEHNGETLDGAYREMMSWPGNGRCTEDTCTG